MMPLTTSGKLQLTSVTGLPRLVMAAATRELIRAWKTAVALKPPSATSCVQALPLWAMTCEVWIEAAWTTMRGSVAASRASEASGARRSIACVRKRAFLPNSAARAFAAVRSQLQPLAVAPGDDDLDGLVRRCGDVEGDARGKAAGAGDQDVAAGHVSVPSQPSSGPSNRRAGARACAS